MDIKLAFAQLIANHPKASWRSKDGRKTPVSAMNTGHLVNALRICARADARYNFDNMRLAAFAHMVREAEHRGIKAGLWIEGK